MATNIIYRWAWTDPLSNYSCELDFLAASTSNIPEGAVVQTLSMRGLLDVQWEWEYEDIYLGMMAHVLKVKLNINEIPEIALHLRDPFVSQNYNISFTDISSTTNLVYKTGNVFKIRIKDENDLTLLEEKFIQKTGIESGYDSGTYEMELDLIHIKRAVMEVMSWEVFRQLRLLTTGMVDTVALHYVSFLYGVGSYSVGACTLSGEGGKDRFWLVPQSKINYFTYEYYQSVYAKFNRESYATFETELWRFPRLYKQLYNGTGNLGTELSSTDVYRCAFYADDTVSSGLGVVLNSMFDAYGKDYETFYDFYKDQSKQFTYILRSDTITIDGQDLLERPKLTINSDVVRRVNASLVNGFSDDVADYNTSQQSSGSEEQVTIPIVANTNCPITSDYEYERYDNVHTAKFGLTMPKNVHRIFDANYNSFYYYEASGSGHISDFYHKVHEYCIYPIGDGLYSSEVATNPAISRELMLLNRDNLLLPLQTETGSSKIIADTILTFLGQDNSVKIEGRISLSKGKGGLGELNWLTGNSELIFDLAEFAPPAISTFFDGFNNRFILTKASVSFKDYGFPVNFECLTRRAM